MSDRNMEKGIMKRGAAALSGKHPRQCVSTSFLYFVTNFPWKIDDLLAHLLSRISREILDLLAHQRDTLFSAIPIIR